MSREEKRKERRAGLQPSAKWAESGVCSLGRLRLLTGKLSKAGLCNLCVSRTASMEEGCCPCEKRSVG